jgi:hypothetical protein
MGLLRQSRAQGKDREARHTAAVNRLSLASGILPSRQRKGGGRSAQNRLPRFLFLAVACALFAAFVSGCGDTAISRAGEELVAEKAIEAALSEEKAEFVNLVAPSFLEQARAEMPDADDQTLGGILIAGFREGIPFAGVVEATYDVEVAGDRASVYLWGSFTGSDGSQIEIGEAEALRIPLTREDGRWFVDLLDL